ncbi:hypothetical protein ES703_48881 [subsurface metagenome]
MSAIYRTKGRAQEYSFLAINHYVGCEHRCKYCYVAGMGQWREEDFFNTPATVRKDVIEQLKREAGRFAGTDERVLLCFMCDPYQPLDDTEQITRKVIEILRQYDIPFQVLTKGGTRAARDFELYGPNDAFATTLTFLDETKSREYEPNAALPRSRLLAIQMAKQKGIQTWMSLEPVLDVEQSLEIIRQTHKFVDLYKIGTLNHQAIGINWRKFGKKAIELCRELKASYYIKRDLAKYLDGFTFCNIDTRKIKRISHEGTKTQGFLF